MPLKRVVAADDGVVGEDGGVLERKDVDCAAQLFRREHQGHRRAAAVPALGERQAGREIAEAEPVHQRAGVDRSVCLIARIRDERGSRGPKTPSRSRARLSIARCCDAEKCGIPRLYVRRATICCSHATANLHHRLLRRRHRTAEPARRAEAESLAQRQRRRHDVRQRRQLGRAARPTRRAAAGRRVEVRAGARAQRARSAARAARAAADARARAPAAGTPAATCCCR